MTSSNQFISANKIQERFGISSSSLRRWDKEGKIQTIRTPGGFRLYGLHDINKLFNEKLLHEEDIIVKKTKICYARVSSDHQRADLERQVQDLRDRCPRHEIIRDIGSGLNYHRRGFQTLLERVHSGNVSEVVVAHKDRLCRYGFELIEFIFKKTDTKLVVLGQRIEEHDTGRELADDLLAICNYFVAKNNGIRSGENRKKRKQAQEKETEAIKKANSSSRKGKEDTPVSESETEGNPYEVVRDDEVDL